MKTIAHILLFLIPGFVFAQSTTNGSNWVYPDSLFTSEINGINVFNSDTFNMIVQRKLIAEKKLLTEKEAYPEVYFTNSVGNKYLKIQGGPDIGYGWFYTIGYTTGKKCTNCGTYLGKQNTSDFIVNMGVKLGDNIEKIWGLAHLNYFRNFMYKGIVYYYYEKGTRHDIPFTPDQIFYYKFKNGQLVEIGFGYGIIGENPMFSGE